MKAAILITSFNRKQGTLRCLESLFQSKSAAELEVFLLDDASTDGTPEAIAAQFPQVHLLHGDGKSFWGGGTRQAWVAAEPSNPDAFVLVNDDVQLDADALDRVFEWNERLAGQALLGCAMRSSATGESTYGGNRRVGIHPMKYAHLEPDPENAIEAAVLHANLLLVPTAVYRKAGIFPTYLVQQGGDFDYSLRARKAGFKAMLLPGTFGICETNPPTAKRRGMAGLRKILGPKELPVRYTVPFYREHCGLLWPIWWVIPYLRAFIVGF
jgi:GT2 family glycosyltransferase